MTTIAPKIFAELPPCEVGSEGARSPFLPARDTRGPPDGYPPRQVLPREARERVLLGVPVGDKLDLAVSSGAGSEEAR